MKAKQKTAKTKPGKPKSIKPVKSLKLRPSFKFKFKVKLPKKGFKIQPFLKVWITISILSTIFCGLAYVLVQQDLRLSADDPQVQLTEDAAVELGISGTEGLTSPDASSLVDISKSLSTFIIIFDDTGKVIYSSAQLNGKTPTPPKGVFDHAKKDGENRFTWQPQSKVRVAAVVKKYSGTSSGYVLFGRSLKEVEKREDNALILTGIAWAGSIASGLVLSFIFFRKK